MILGNKKIHVDTYVNDEDNQIVWHMKGSVRDCMKAQRNVACYDMIIQNVFKNKMMRRFVEEKDAPELEDMLKNNTTVEVIKKATAEEMDEYNKTWWQRIKEKWTKKTNA